MQLAHAFYFKWPRIQEGLIHEQCDFHMLQSNHANLPEGTFIFTDCWWRIYRDMHWRAGYSTLNHRKVPEETVPAEIRTHLLLLT